MVYAPLVIAFIALLFSISSFWWLNVKRGQIILSKPIRFGLNYSKTNKNIIIRLPLVFYNNGPVAIIVNNLRLKIDNEGQDEYLFYNNISKDIENDEGWQWGSTFSVEGRNTYSQTFTFMKRDIDFIIPINHIKYSIEAKLNNKDNWKELLHSELLTPTKFHVTMNKIMRAYDCCKWDNSEIRSV